MLENEATIQEDELKSSFLIAEIVCRNLKVGMRKSSMHAVSNHYCGGYDYDTAVVRKVEYIF